MHDLADTSSDIVYPTSKTETGLGDVAAHRENSLCIRVTGTEQAQQGALHALRDLVIVYASHQRIYPTIAAL